MNIAILTAMLLCSVETNIRFDCKIPSVCHRNFCQFVVNFANCVSTFTTFASICMASLSQDGSHFARRNLLAELVEKLQ